MKQVWRTLLRSNFYYQTGAWYLWVTTNFCTLFRLALPLFWRFFGAFLALFLNKKYGPESLLPYMSIWPPCATPTASSRCRKPTGAPPASGAPVPSRLVSQNHIGKQYWPQEWWHQFAPNLLVKRRKLAQIGANWLQLLVQIGFSSLTCSITKAVLVGSTIINILAPSPGRWLGTPGLSGLAQYHLHIAPIVIGVLVASIAVDFFYW